MNKRKVLDIMLTMLTTVIVGLIVNMPVIASPLTPSTFSVSPSGEIEAAMNSENAGWDELPAKQYRYSSYYDFSHTESFTVDVGFYRNGGNATAFCCYQYVGLQASDGTWVVPLQLAYYVGDHRKAGDGGVLNIYPTSATKTIYVPKVSENPKVKDARVVIQYQASYRKEYSYQSRDSFSYRVTVGSVRAKTLQTPQIQALTGLTTVNFPAPLPYSVHISVIPLLPQRYFLSLLYIQFSMCRHLYIEHNENVLIPV